MTRKPTRYEEFWPYYVWQHSDPVCRALHFVGNTLAFASAIAGVLVSPLWFAAAPIIGYGFAWVGHFWFEKNVPASFSAPLWSVRSGLRMYQLTLLRRMAPEVRRATELFGTRS